MQRVCLLLALLGLSSACDPDSSLDAGADASLDAGRDAGGMGREACSLDAGAVDAAIARGLTGTCAEGLILSGFGLRFAEGASALSRFAVYPQLTGNLPEGCPASATLRGATLVADLGAEGTVRVSHHVIGAEGFAAPDAGAGWVGLRTARGSVTVDLVEAAGVGTASELFDLSLSGMASAPAVAVVLDGIEVDTDVAQGPDYPADYDPADGYTVRGWGAGIEEVTREGDDLRFRARAELQLGRGDEPAMNRALSEARVRMVVHYQIVALPVVPVTGEVRYDESHFGHVGPELEVCRPDPALTELIMEGADLPHAAPALTRFSMTFFDPEGIDGDRLRELSMGVSGFVWDPGARRASMRVEGYASNAGPPAPLRPMRTLVEAEVALLQWEGTDSVESLRFEAPITATRNAIELPMSAR